MKLTPGSRPSAVAAAVEAKGAAAAAEGAGGTTHISDGLRAPNHKFIFIATSQL